MRIAHHGRMSYSVTLWCGCKVYVSCNPATGIAHSRIVESRGTVCSIRRHEVGARLWLWELLPEPSRQVDILPGEGHIRSER